MRKGFLLSVPKPLPSSQPPPPPLPDRLSSLQDDILIIIISLLCTDEMVRTGILSRRWHRLWTQSPILHFAQNFSISTYETLEIDDYPSITDLCLSHCSSNPKLVSAGFPIARGPISNPTSTADADRWIRFASARSVERLAFSPIFCGTHRVPMPPSLFECHSLTELHLNSCSIRSAAPAACFPSLRTIVLTVIDIRNDSMEALLESSPRLESLSLTKVGVITRLVIRALNMRHLMVYDCGYLQRLEVVEAPELRRLMYMGNVSKIGNLEGKVPRLDEVALLSNERAPFRNPICWKCLVRAVAHARVFTVNNWILKFRLKDFGTGDQQVVFKNLKELHWWPVHQISPGAPAEPWSADKMSTNSLHALLSLLRDCPSLERLCIRATYAMEHEDNTLFMLVPRSFHRRNFRQLAPLNIDSSGYEFPCLKKVNITEFSGTKFEMRLVKFLIERAAALENVTLHYVEDVERELEEICRELTSVHAASPHASISFSEFDEDEVCPKHEYMWYKYMIW